MPRPSQRSATTASGVRSINRKREARPEPALAGTAAEVCWARWNAVASRAINARTTARDAEATGGGTGDLG